MGRHPGVVARRVQVEIVLTDVAGNTSATMWTIHRLRPGDKARRNVDRPYSHPLAPVGAVRLYAEIIETDPAEPPGFQFNNATEHWGTNRTDWHTDGDTAVGVSISDRFPPVEGATTFMVYAGNFPGDRFSSADSTSIQHDAQIDISLSPGVDFAETQPQAPSGTTFDPATGIWNVGALAVPGQTGNVRSLPVTVNLSNDSLADLPLEERCLTAKVLRAMPWFAFDRSKRGNDTATVCLGRTPGCC